MRRASREGRAIAGGDQRPRETLAPPPHCGQGKRSAEAGKGAWGCRAMADGRRSHTHPTHVSGRGPRGRFRGGLADRRPRRMRRSWPSSSTFCSLSAAARDSPSRLYRCRAGGEAPTAAAEEWRPSPPRLRHPAPLSLPPPLPQARAARPAAQLSHVPTPLHPFFAAPAAAAGRRRAPPAACAPASATPALVTWRASLSFALAAPPPRGPAAGLGLGGLAHPDPGLVMA